MAVRLVYQETQVNWVSPDKKPEQRGVYRVMVPVIKGTPVAGYAKWNGRTWLHLKPTADDAKKQKRASMWSGALYWKEVSM